MPKITDSRAADLLCGAFEGGSNYWYTIADRKEPEVLAQPWGEGEYTPMHISYPFSEGGALIIEDMEDEDVRVTLDREAIERGKKLLTENPDYNSYLVDVLDEQDDAETGDVFLQLCVFGEVIYG